MRTRFNALRGCRTGRIAKNKFSTKKKCPQQSVEIFPNPSTEWNVDFEGPRQAFRSYAASSPKTKSLILEQTLDNSQHIVSRLLMMDGSMLLGSAGHQVCPTIPRSPNDNNSNEVPKEEFGSAIVRTSKQNSTTKRYEASDRRSSSIQILQARLSSKYSLNYLRHISYIQRYSSSNSWRSSLISFCSLASSLSANRSSGLRETISFHSSTISVHDTSRPMSLCDNTNGWVLPSGPKSRKPATQPTKPKKHKNKANNSIAATKPESKQSSHRQQDEKQLSKAEEEVWHELIDETLLAKSFNQRPEYGQATPRYRSCCSNLWFLSSRPRTCATCQTCGYTEDHRRVLNGALFQSVSPSQTDFYGNTILHCAAANVQPDCYWKINVMVTDENSIHRVNTMGQSFLHLLCESPLLSTVDIGAFIRLLRELQARNFSFSTRDYHGQTFLHTLFNRTDICMFVIPALSEIFSIVQLDLNAPDNLGFKISERLLSDPRVKRHFPAIKDLVRQHSLGRPLFDDGTTTSSIISWIERRIQSGDVTSLSDDGDAMLSYILKHGPSTDGGRFLANCTRKLTAAGARIHMRDRNGDTPMCIATRRGLRPVVTLLLRRGAHVHARNYECVGILVQAETAMIEAKSVGDEVLYSGILSCIVTLIEAGAKCEPSEEDEWISRKVVTQVQEQGMNSPVSENTPDI